MTETDIFDRVLGRTRSEDGYALWLAYYGSTNIYSCHESIFAHSSDTLKGIVAYVNARYKKDEFIFIVTRCSYPRQRPGHGACILLASSCLQMKITRDRNGEESVFTDCDEQAIQAVRLNKKSARRHASSQTVLET